MSAGLFYEQDGISIYLGDSREIVPHLSRPDMVLDDPPYGISYKSTHNTNRTGPWGKWSRDKNFDGIAGDDKPFDPTPFLIAPRMAFFGANYFAGKLPDSRCWIVWNKRHGIGQNDNADCEMIWTNFDKPSRVFNHVWSGLIRAGEENVSRQSKFHPHQKPLALLRYLIRYSELPPNSLILVPHCGSGSELVAAKEMGHRGIGIEIDERHCTTAVNRLSQGMLTFANPS